MWICGGKQTWVVTRCVCRLNFFGLGPFRRKLSTGHKSSITKSGTLESFFQGCSQKRKGSKKRCEPMRCEKKFERYYHWNCCTYSTYSITAKRLPTVGVVYCRVLGTVYSGTRHLHHTTRTKLHINRNHNRISWSNIIIIYSIHRQRVKVREDSWWNDAAIDLFIWINNDNKYRQIIINK